MPLFTSIDAEDKVPHAFAKIITENFIKISKSRNLIEEPLNANIYLL